jgi:hypothetical protein
MPPEQFRLGQPPLGPPCIDLLDPEADLTPAWFSKIEGWAPDELRGVKLAQLDDGVSGLRFLDACRAILTPELSWVDVRDVCSRLLVASSMLSHATRAKVSASEGSKAMACLPYHMQTLPECDRWLWGQNPIPGARTCYDELRAELVNPESGEPCEEFSAWWARERRRSVTFFGRPIPLFWEHRDGERGT